MKLLNKIGLYTEKQMRMQEFLIFETQKRVSMLVAECMDKDREIEALKEEVKNLRFKLARKRGRR